ncbi:MAG: cytochrome c3 family protein [Elusimicrobia bacterium]|nr:cytochrome c3 family protein [Elusimicrobiota bacterium]
MRKSWSLFVVVGALAAAFIFAGSAKADGDKEKKEPAKVEAKAEAKAEGEAKEAPEFINFDKAKMGNVKFPHKKHAEMVGNCDTCHAGKEPLFAKEKTEGMKMADMYAGKTCGHCHDGKMKVGEKVVFEAKKSCMKCHKKEAAKK